MANTLGAYNPIFYAQETLIHLRKVLGMAARVHRGYDRERRSFERGDIIRIKKPSTFVAADAPSSAVDLNTQTVDITLNQWKEVKYALTDKELAYTGPEIIQDHIEPAAYALADNMDQALCALYKDIPWQFDYTTQTDAKIIVDLRKVLFDNAVPLTPGMIHLQVDSVLEAYFLKDTIFHSANVAGGAAEPALMRGSLGTRFGVECFANQNAPQHTPGTVTTTGDNAGALAADVALGATSMSINALTDTQTVKAGDTFVIAGNTQRYAVVTATATVASNAIAITVTPPAVQAYSSTAVVTFSTGVTAAAHSQQLIFHRNAFALAMAPLPDNLPGIDAFTAVDPVTGLAVRARRFAEGNNSKLYMALDVLYGVKTLDPNLAARGWT